MTDIFASIICLFFLTQTVCKYKNSTPFKTTTNSIYSSFFFYSPDLLPQTFSTLITSISPVGPTESRENSFSRSRSSSVSSIDRDTKEAITTLHFGESYGRKGDAVPTPCLWVGSSLGVVLVIPMSVPTDQEERMEEPVAIGPSGKSP